MKKFIAFLFISLFVGQINAATMPVYFNEAGTTIVASTHDHCQGAESVGHTENGNSTSSTSVTHYCCAVVAILTTSPEFFALKQIDVHLLGDASTPISNTAESIYKPPRNYL
jgi:hypothetical protein